MRTVKSLSCSGRCVSRACVGGLYLALAGVYTFVGLWRYRIFRAGVDDGVFTQIANSTFSGFSSTVEGANNHLLVHCSPILIVAAPFVIIFHGAVGLIMLQAFAAAAVVFPVWAMARARFPQYVAFGLTIIAAAYPPLSAEATGDFHELAFAPALTAGLACAVDRRRWRNAIVAALALVCVKEDQFVSLAFIGIILALTAGVDRGQRRCGLSVATIAVAAAAIYFGLVRPSINASFPYWSLHYYEWWRFPPTPAGFAGWNSPVRVEYLVGALAPLAFLPVFSRFFIFALPGLAEVLLSHEGVTMLMGAHYGGTWSGYVLCAFVDGASRVRARSTPAAGAAVLVATVGTMALDYYSPIEPGYYLYRKPTAEDEAKDRLLQSLPSDASMWSDYFLFAHLGMNPQASVNMRREHYLIFDPAADVEWRSRDVQQLVASGSYRVLQTTGGLVVLQKR